MEGPSLVILREELSPFLGENVKKVSGNTKQPKETLQVRRLERIETWGKALFLVFSDARKKLPPIITKTHFMMFGSYRVNEPKENRIPRLQLEFRNGIVYFYSSSFQMDAGDYLGSVDREVDIMSPEWNPRHVIDLMNHKRKAYLCDLFLDQTVFAGSGNIVKNEVLFNLRRHPLTRLSQVQKKDWSLLAKAIHEYGGRFYEWKKKFELRRHWQVYRKGACPVCDTKLIRKNTGKLERRSFYCPRCQALDDGKKKLKIHPVIPMAITSAPERRFDH